MGGWGGAGCFGDASYALTASGCGHGRLDLIRLAQTCLDLHTLTPAARLATATGLRGATLTGSSLARTCCTWRGLGRGHRGGCPRGSNVLCEGGVVHDGAVHGVVHGVGVRWWGGAVRWGACGWGGMEFAACNQGLLHGVVSLTTPLSPMPIPGSTKCAVSARVPAATTRSLWRGMAWRYRRWRGRRGCSGEIRGWWGWGCGVCDVRWMAIGAMARAAGVLG